MSYAPMKAFGSRSLTDAIVAQFLRPLRAPLAGLALVADKQMPVGDWGDENITWDTLGEMSSVTLSMDFPPLRSEGMDWTTATVESPIWTKDIKWSGRKYRALENSWRRRVAIAQATGGQPTLDGVPSLGQAIIQEMGEAMALGMNAQILTGSGTGKPGSTTGVLNHTGVINVTGGLWTDTEVMDGDLGDGVSQARDRRYHGTRWALLFNPADEHLFETFLPGGGGARLGDNMRSSISRILPDENVAAQTAYLVPDVNDHNAYKWAHPEDDPTNGFMFGIGNVTPGFVSRGPDMSVLRSGTMQEKRDEMFKTVALRFLNIGTIVPMRTGTGNGGSGTVKFTFQT